MADDEDAMFGGPLPPPWWVDLNRTRTKLVVFPSKTQPKPHRATGIGGQKHMMLKPYGPYMSRQQAIEVAKMEAPLFPGPELGIVVRAAYEGGPETVIWEAGKPHGGPTWTSEGADDTCNDCMHNPSRAGIPETGKDDPQPTGYVNLQGQSIGMTRDPDGEWTIWEGHSTTATGFRTKEDAMDWVRATGETRTAHLRHGG